MRQWTDAQLRAITASGDILVSAAAGSGKTATLTERIVRKIKGGADIRRILVVTFTKAAAAELRQRIGQSLADAVEDDPNDSHAASQLLSLGEAKIGTIHSFCMSVLRQRYAVVGLPPSFRVADSGEAATMERTVMDELLDELYESSDAKAILSPYNPTAAPCVDFITLADNFARVKNDAGLSESFLGVYKSLKPQIRGVGVLADCADSLLEWADADFLGTPFGEAAVAETMRLIRHYGEAFGSFIGEMKGDPVYGKAYVPAAEADLGFLESLQTGLFLRDYDCCADIFAAYSPMRLGTVRGEKDPAAVRFIEERSDFKDSVAKEKADLWQCPPEVTARHFRETAAVCRTLFMLLSAFEARFSARKSRVGICDFTDLERLTLKLLVEADGSPTAVAAETGAAFDEIYIDEFQDTNRVQDAIFAAVAGVCGSGRRTPRFMVGDIKQSIYRFRGAEPSVFAAYRRSFSQPDSGGTVIYLSQNFRSDGAVTDFVNAVSKTTFGGTDSIDYRDEDALVCGTGVSGNAISVYLVASSKEDDAEGDSADASLPEAECVAGIVSRLLSEGRLDDGSPVMPSDIAVLIRSANTRGAAFQKAIDRSGAPCVVRAGDDFFDAPIIELAVCLLMAADNLTRDVYTAGMLCSPLFNFTLGDLVLLGNAGGGKAPIWRYVEKCAAEEDSDPALAAKCRYAVEKLDKYRAAAAAVPADRFVRYVFGDCGIYAAAGNEADRRRLDMLYELARRCESYSFHGLHGFTEYLGTIASQNGGIDASDDGGENVTVMSIHASKGLEYPVVILADCSHRINEKELAGDMLFCPTMPVRDGKTTPQAAMKLRVKDEPVREDTILRRAAAMHMREEMLYEEMRILYVAMTRAKQRLIITAAVKEPDKTIEAANERAKYGGRLSEMRLLSAKCFLDWLLPSCVSSQSVQLTAVSAQGTAEICKYAGSAAAEIDEAGVVKLLRGRFTARLSAKESRAIPAKLSVSRLYPSILDEDEAPAAEDLTDEKAPAVPEFISHANADGLTGAQRGTATHVFLQFCDYERVNGTAASVEQELSRLIERRFLPAEYAAAVYKNEAARFFGSDIFRRMKHADTLYREFRFNVLLDAAQFTADSEYAADLQKSGEKVLVQGVVDAYFTDGDGAVLLDYKTDRLTRAEIKNDALAYAKLSERHRTQLGYYREAVRLIFGAAHVKTYIYSTCSGKCYEIPEKEESL